MCKLEFIIWQRNESLLCYTSFKARYSHKQEWSFIHTRIWNTNSHLLQVYLGGLAKIETVIKIKSVKFISNV